MWSALTRSRLIRTARTSQHPVEGWPQVKRAQPTQSGGVRSGCVSRRLCRARLVSGSSGVDLGDGEADFFEFGDQFAEPFVVVEPGTVVGAL